MNEEAQRIAIAEACGWKKEADGLWWRNGLGIAYDYSLPDYLNDLNVMHEAEKVLGSKWTLYQDWLIKLTINARPREPIWCATAAQRSEAFLKTLGLWKD